MNEAKNKNPWDPTEDPDCRKCEILQRGLCGWTSEEQERRIQRGLKRDSNGLWHYVPTPVGKKETDA